MRLAEPPVPSPAAAHRSAGDYLRLTGCPRCDSRRRALVEVAGRLRGRCLACGEELSLPLAVESQPRLELVGRAGQRVWHRDGSPE